MKSGSVCLFDWNQGRMVGLFLVQYGDWCRVYNLGFGINVPVNLVLTLTADTISNVIIARQKTNVIVSSSSEYQRWKRNIGNRYMRREWFNKTAFRARRGWITLCLLCFPLCFHFVFTLFSSTSAWVCPWLRGNQGVMTRTGVWTQRRPSTYSSVTDSLFAWVFVSVFGSICLCVCLS